MSSESPGPFAPSAPAGIPTTPSPARAAELSRVRPIVAVAVQILYALACVVTLFVLNSRLSLSNRVLQGDMTVTEDQARAADSNVSAMVAVLIVAFVLLVIAVFLWERNVTKALGKPVARTLRRRTGLQIAWILWAVLWVVGSSTQSGVPNTPQALIDADHRSMYLLGARAALLIVIAVLTLVTNNRAQEELRRTPVVQPLVPLGY